MLATVLEVTKKKKQEKFMSARCIGLDLSPTELFFLRGGFFRFHLRVVNQ